MIKVGFVINLKGQEWLGGSSYFRNLFNAIYSLSERNIEPVLFTGSKSNIDWLKDFPTMQIIKTPFLDIFSINWAIRNIYKRAFRRDWFLERLLKKNNISVLSHYNFSADVKVPTIGWIPDFQHRYLPEFFTPKEIVNRDRVFRNMLRFSSCVILSSYTAQKHLADFAPDFVSKSKVLQFSVRLPSDFNFPKQKELEKRYKIEGPYFHVPNQFWKHKNHRLIIEALRILKSQNRRIQVLATGNGKDYRQTSHLNSIIDYAKKCQVFDSFKILGILPYSDLLGAMLHSVAIINPSLFEGWSTSVEEAKSLGKRIILSDIPVHREQSPAGGFFFPPSDAPALADAMWSAWSSYSLDAEEKRLKEAREFLPTRVMNFAKNYENIVLSIVK